jgi:exopolysaccharide production protein ExoZ
MAHDVNRSRAASGDLAKLAPAAGEMPQPGRRIVSIQYLRALAALAVVASHAQPDVFIGQAGVDIFFVISGYIMWMIARSEPTILNFVSARATRIVPLYWLATMIMSLRLHAPADAVLKSMLFIPFIGERGRIWPILVPGWTLDYEMFFYAVISVSLFVPGRKRLIAVLSTLTAMSAVGAAFRFTDPLLQTYTNPMLLEFCLGIILSEVQWRKLPAKPFLIAAMFVVSVVLYALLPGTEYLVPWRVLAWGVPSALLVASALACEANWRVPSLGLLLLLGEASYAIYLFHPFILKTVLKLSGRNPILGAGAVVVSASLLGVFVTRFVERPLRRFLRRARGGLYPPRVEPDYAMRRRVIQGWSEVREIRPVSVVAKPDAPD